MLLALHVARVTCSLRHMDYHSMLPFVRLSSYGFQAGGKFHFNVSTESASHTMMLMFDSNELKTIFSSSTTDIIMKACENTSREYAKMNFTAKEMASSFEWSGTVPKDSLYTTYIIDCDRNPAQYVIDADYRNPNSPLDVRDRFNIPMYNLLQFAYYVIFMIWMLNALQYTMFRIPLHTIFSVMPIVKAVSLMLSGQYWKSIRDDIMPADWLEDAIFILNIIYYTAFLSAISYIGTGWCIFRTNVGAFHLFQLLFSSLFIVCGFLLIPKLQNINYIIISLILVAINFFWFLKVNFVNFIIICRLLEQMIKEPVVKEKIKLAKDFLSSCFITLINTLFICGITMATETHKVISRGILEVGFLIGSILHMKYFMFRREYFGDGTEYGAKHRSYVKEVHVRTLVEPKNTSIVMFTCIAE